jgi:hypothetical protein
VVLEKDSEVQLDRSCEGQGGKECPTNNKRKTNWIGHILRRNCLLKHVIEGKIAGRIEVTRIQERRCKRLLGDIKENRGDWKLKFEYESTRSHSVENWLWKSLWTCRNTTE